MKGAPVLALNLTVASLFFTEISDCTFALKNPLLLRYFSICVREISTSALSKIAGGVPRGLMLCVLYFPFLVLKILYIPSLSPNQPAGRISF